MDEALLEGIIEYYTDEEVQSTLELFLDQVSSYFEKNPALKRENVVHSIKKRIKDPNHLREKIIRKLSECKYITKDNLFQEVTDLNGVRVLHIYQYQFDSIHKQILKKVNDVQDWIFVEDPKAYTWDPESKEFFERIGIKTEIKDSYYTSVHYVVKPNNDKNKCTCEIQVRTVFEEIWGEIDHEINYPVKTENMPCREQLKVLAKLISTGTRLADSIHKTYEEYKSNRE